VFLKRAGYGKEIEIYLKDNVPSVDHASMVTFKDSRFERPIWVFECQLDSDSLNKLRADMGRIERLLKNNKNVSRFEMDCQAEYCDLHVFVTN
jgi:hypothetical protein